MIDYSKLANSEKYYSDLGYKRIEVPWTVSENIDNITKPADRIHYQLKHNNNFVTLGKLFRCVNQNYSDGRLELLVDCSDVHPSYCFWLRSIKPFKSYKVMEKSIKSLIKNIDYWEQEKFNNYFRNKPFG